MQTHLTAVLLITAASLAGCTAEEVKSPTGSETTAVLAETFRDIDVAGAARLIAEDNSVVILDIRTPGEFAGGHIKGAMNIDFMADDFATQLAPLDKDTVYIVHCQSGGRSGKSLPLFRELGFKTVIHLDAGFAGWQKAGQAVEK